MYIFAYEGNFCNGLPRPYCPQNPKQKHLLLKSKIRLEKFDGTETDPINFPQNLKSKIG